jgi:hypothetical protein
MGALNTTKDGERVRAYACTYHQKRARRSAT